MKLRDLWIKYEKTGVNGNPVITDDELKELSEKLAEVAEFLDGYNVAGFGLRFNKMGVDNMIRARKD